MTVTYDKQDDTYAKIIINGEEVGWLEKHKIFGYYRLVMFHESHWIGLKVTRKELDEIVTKVYKIKRFEIYSEVRLENKGFKILG